MRPTTGLHPAGLITCLQIDVSSWADIADLRLRPSLSDRGVPPGTGVNGTALDRRSSGHLLAPSPREGRGAGQSPAMCR